ncbi:MAG: hypothetical protein K9I84_03475 [Leadbetterella sp.]|jgi:hypothetical protein|nr:hypothetical protein [Leadbetterella sp.]
MDYEKIVRICSKRLKNGETYREIREELFDKYFPEDALQIANDSYRAFRKESVKSSIKSLAIGILLLTTTYLIAPPNHAFKPKITIALCSFLIIKTAYDWYQIRKSEKEYMETEPQI